MGKPRAGTQVVSVVLPDEQVRLIDELAERMGQTRSKMLAMLIEAALEDNELAIRTATIPAVKQLFEMVVTQFKREAGRKPVTR